MSRGRLEGKVVVITGGASGIGKASSLLFADEGARVAIGDLRDAADVVAAIERSGGDAFCQTADVTVEANVRDLIEAAVSKWSKLDVLFNNAGVGLRKSVVDASQVEHDQVFDTNVRGTFFGCKYALPHLIKGGGGSIINMSSNGGLVGRSNDPIYCAAAHAIIGLTRSLAVAYADANVRVNALCPGPIDTPLLRKHSRNEAEFASHLPALLCSCPAARCGTAAEVAHAALFLASDECTFINGAGLAIDGAKGAGIMPNRRYNMDFEIKN